MGCARSAAEVGRQHDRDDILPIYAGQGGWVASAMLPGPPPVGTLMWLRPTWDKPEERMVVTELELILVSIVVDGEEHLSYYVVRLSPDH